MSLDIPLLRNLICALVWATQRLHHYMLYHTNLLISRMDSLNTCWRNPTYRGGWHLLLLKFDITQITQNLQKSKQSKITEQKNPSRVTNQCQISSHKSILNIEIGEEHLCWHMYFDGVVNVHRNDWRHTDFPWKCSPLGVIQLRFSCTNNIAEYEACIASLKAAVDMRVKDLEVYKHSILIISQLTENGKYESHN